MTEPIITAADMAEFRAMTEGMMVDTCTITRIIGEPIDDDGAVTPERETAYEGKCKVQSLDPQEATPEAGGHTFTIQRMRVDVPVAKTVEDYKPQIGDQVTITTSELDPHLVGTKYRVAALLHKTRATAYRLAVTNEPV